MIKVYLDGGDVVSLSERRCGCKGKGKERTKDQGECEANHSLQDLNEWEYEL